MKLKAPIITLAAGAAVAAGLLIANIATNGGGDTAVTAAPAAAATSAAPSASASPSPSATVSASPAAVSASPAAATGVATYAGKVNGGGSLSVVVKGESVIAYLCDGRNEAWLWGTASGTSVSAKNKAGDTLTATRGGGKLTGSITVNGKKWTFTLPSVKKPSGLYRATANIRGAKVVGGWVVLSDGTQVGVLNRDGVAEPAPAIDLASGQVTVDGTTLAASEPDPEVVTGG